MSEANGVRSVAKDYIDDMETQRDRSERSERSPAQQDLGSRSFKGWGSGVVFEAEAAQAGFLQKTPTAARGEFCSGGRLEAT